MGRVAICIFHGRSGQKWTTRLSEAGPDTLEKVRELVDQFTEGKLETFSMEISLPNPKYMKTDSDELVEVSFEVVHFGKKFMEECAISLIYEEHEEES